jgi:hypothetical protein
MVRLILISLLLTGMPSVPDHERISNDEVTLTSLLREMTDRDGLARFKDFECLQASSYDRHSVAKGQAGWFANLDRNWWLRIERERGRREFVMMDAQGPGAVTRFWMTTYADLLEGIVRVYLDGAREPVIEGPMKDLMGSETLVPYPLAASVPEKNEARKRGYNLFLPVPFAKSCKITFEGDSIDELNLGADNTRVGKFYYNIEYRKYPAGTSVRTLDKNALKATSGAIEAACRMLAEKPSEGAEGCLPLNCVLKPGRSRTFRLGGEKAIRTFSLDIQAEDMAKALRSLVIEISFDGHRTVSVPAGDFFGTGKVMRKFSTRMASSDGQNMEAYWTMPFRRSCKLTLRNTSDADISIVSGELRYGSWNWDGESMHFCANWAEETYAVGPSEGQYDLDFLSVEGRGTYVGTVFSITNGAKKWWGEGDEKIYVDGESFPSHFGTGSEDYVGYAWSSGTPFEHPFIAQPCGEGAGRPGFVSNVRWRFLDAIPFRKSLDFDMELLQVSVPGTITYGRVNFWYMTPKK